MAGGTPGLECEQLEIAPSVARCLWLGEFGTTTTKFEVHIEQLFRTADIGEAYRLWPRLPPWRDVYEPDESVALVACILSDDFSF